MEIKKGGDHNWAWRYSGEAWAPKYYIMGFKNYNLVIIWAAMRADGRIIYRIVRDFYKGGTT